MLAPEQKNYIEARAWLEALEVDLFTRVGNPPTEDEAYEQLREQLGLWHAEQELRQTEEALRAWGIAIVRQQPQYQAHSEAIEKLFASKLLKFRDAVVDLLLKLDTSTSRRRPSL